MKPCVRGLPISIQYYKQTINMSVSTAHTWSTLFLGHIQETYFILSWNFLAPHPYPQNKPNSSCLYVFTPFHI